MVASSHGGIAGSATMVAPIIFRVPFLSAMASVAPPVLDRTILDGVVTHGRVT